MRLEEVRRRLLDLPATPGGTLDGGWPAWPQWLRPVRTDGIAIPERPTPGSDARRAAVLVCLWANRAGDAVVLLTERPDYDGAHAGQVSFPGGSEEPGDGGDPALTALREAHEEVGLDAAACGLTVIGHLEPTWIPPSNFVVLPVVAVAARPPALVADPREVAAILTPPIAAFLPDAPHAIVERDTRGWPLRYGAYPIEGRMVWGATARMLAQLGALLAR